MAQYDVYRIREGGLVVDCQAEIFADLNSRLVVPLVSPREVNPVSPRLNPTFMIDDEPFVFRVHFAAAVPARALNETVSSLAGERYVIQAAFDFLLSGA